MPSYFTWDSAYLVWTRLHLVYIFAMCAFWAILCLFYCAPPHTPPTWQMFQIMLVYIILIWKVSGCSNHGPILFFLCCGSLFLNDTFGHGNMLAKIKCLCSGGKNKVSMRDHDPWFIPYEYGIDDWVVFWCIMLVL